MGIRNKKNQRHVITNTSSSKAMKFNQLMEDDRKEAASEPSWKGEAAAGRLGVKDGRRGGGSCLRQSRGQGEGRDL